jgi:hypothetical protein
MNTEGRYLHKGERLEMTDLQNLNGGNSSEM